MKKYRRALILILMALILMALVSVESRGLRDATSNEEDAVANAIHAAEVAATKARKLTKVVNAAAKKAEATAEEAEIQEVMDDDDGEIVKEQKKEVAARTKEAAKNAEKNRPDDLENVDTKISGAAAFPRFPPKERAYFEFISYAESPRLALRTIRKASEESFTSIESPAPDRGGSAESKNLEKRLKRALDESSASRDSATEENETLEERAAPEKSSTSDKESMGKAPASDEAPELSAGLSIERGGKKESSTPSKYSHVSDDAIVENSVLRNSDPGRVCKFTFPRAGGAIKTKGLSHSSITGPVTNFAVRARTKAPARMTAIPLIAVYANSEAKYPLVLVHVSPVEIVINGRMLTSKGSEAMWPYSTHKGMDFAVIVTAASHGTRTRLQTFIDGEKALDVWANFIPGGERGAEKPNVGTINPNLQISIGVERKSAIKFERYQGTVAGIEFWLNSNGITIEDILEESGKFDSHKILDSPPTWKWEAEGEVKESEGCFPPTTTTTTTTTSSTTTTTTTTTTTKEEEEEEYEEEEEELDEEEETAALKSPPSSPSPPTKAKKSSGCGTGCVVGIAVGICVLIIIIIVIVVYCLKKKQDDADNANDNKYNPLFQPESDDDEVSLSYVDESVERLPD